MALYVYLVGAVALGDEPAPLDDEIQYELSLKTFRYIELEFPVVVDGDSAQPVEFYSIMFFRGEDLLELRERVSRVEADLRSGQECWSTRNFLPYFDSSLGRYEFEWVEEEFESAPLIREISGFLDVISRAIQTGCTVKLRGS